MVSVTGFLAILVGLGIGLWMNRAIRDAQALGFGQAVLALLRVTAVAIVVNRWVIPWVVGMLLQGQYAASAHGIGLLVGLGLYVLTIILFGAFATKLIALEGWHQQAIWIATIFFGAIAGKMLFWGELQKWWYWKVLPSPEIWAYNLKLNWNVPVIALVVVGVLLVARFISSKV